MRKSLILMLIATLIVGAFLVSCNSDIAGESSNGDKLVQVSISGDDKGISATLTQDNADSYYWYYSATKTDSSVYRTGQTTWKAVKNEPGLKGANLGYFSTGDWKFSFYGYKTDGEEEKVDGYVYYQEDISVKVNDTTYITVALKEGSLASTATVVFSSLNWKYEPEANANYSATLDFLNGKTATMYFEYKADGADSYSTGWAYGSGTITTSASDATATFNIENSELDATSLGKNYKLKYWVQIGEEFVSSVNTIDVVAYHGSTITLSVDSSDVAVTDNEEVKQVIVDDYIVAISSKSKQTTEMSGDETKTNTAEITFTANVSETIDEATVVTFPTESISTSTESTDYKVEMEVVVYQTEAAQAKFVIETEDTSAFAGLDLSAALITTTTVEEVTTTNSEAIETFNDKAVSVTTYIAKGLTDVDVKYTGINNYGDNTHPSNVSYNPATGALTFTTTHFSEFVVVAEQNVYDKTNNTGYKLSAEGRLLDKDNNVVEADSTHEYLLLDSTKANSVNDAIDVFNAGFNWSVVHEASDTPDTENFAGGYGTKIEPYLIADATTFQNISTKFADGYCYYMIKSGVTQIDCSHWVPVNLYGSFNGNNATLNNLDESLFRMVGPEGNDTNLASWNQKDVAIKNFNVVFKTEGTIDSATGLVKNLYGSNKTTFENIHTTGTLISGSNGGVFFCYTSGNDSGNNPDHSWATVPSNFMQEIYVKDCTVATTIYAPSNCVGIVGGHYCLIPDHLKVVVNNVDSIFTGNYYSQSGNYRIMNGASYGATSDSTPQDTVKSCTKITVATVSKGEDFYTTTVNSADVSKIKVFISAQLSKTGTGLSGITMSLKEYSTQEITTTGNYNVLPVFTGVDYRTIQDDFDAYIDGSSLVAKIGGTTAYDYGTIKLVVMQYKADGSLVAAKTHVVAEKENAGSEWSIK